MEKIQHRNVLVNGINMHVAEIGEGPPVLFVHGFPELWYSWRHQMLYLASKGYRAIAPDLRGYGDSDAPAGVHNYTVFHIVGDLVGLLDALEVEQVFLVGHDWGAIIAWYLSLFRADRVKALVNTSVMYRYPLLHHSRKPVEAMRDTYGDDYYVCRFQEPGEIEEVFGGVDTALFFKMLLSNRDPGPLLFPKELGSRIFLGGHQIPIPSWLTEEDLNYFGSKFSRKGFTGPVNYYRALDLDWELLGAWRDAKIEVPVKFIVGDLDLTYHVAGMKEYLEEGGGFKKDVPDLRETVVVEGAGHFINQEKAQEISAHIYDFITKF